MSTFFYPQCEIKTSTNYVKSEQKQYKEKKKVTMQYTVQYIM